MTVILLFTTIVLVNSSTAKSESDREGSINSMVIGRPQQQYLGDLSENSPLPFSIPLDLNTDTPAGTYSVSLRVIYSDNLRNTHELILDGNVEYEPVLPQSNAGSQNLSFMNIILVATIAAAVIVTSILFIRRRRKKGVYSQRRSIDNLGNKEVDLFLSDESNSELKR